MTTHGHEHPGIFQRGRQEESVLPPKLEATDSNYGGPSNPEDFNNKNNQDPRRRGRITKVVGAVLGTLGIAVGGVMVGKAVGGNKNAAPSHETTTSAPATIPTSEAPSTSTTPTETTPSATETTPAFHYTPENPALIAALEAMTPAEFAKQPGSARRAWFVSKLAEVLYDGADSSGTVDPITIEEYTLQDGTKLLEHSPIPPDPTDPDTKTTPLTRNSNPKDVLSYDLYVRNMISSWENDELNGQGLSGKDVATAEKMLSGNIESIASDEYDNDRKSLHANTGKLTVMKTKELKAYDVIEASPRLYKVKDSEDEIREAQTITYSANNGHNAMEYVFEEIPEFGKSPEGLPYGIWLRTERKPLN